MTLVSVLARRLRQEQTLRGIAQAVIAGLRAMPGVIAVAIVGFDRTGTPCVWIGDDSFEPVTVEAYLAGTRRDPCEDRAAGALLRVVPIAGSSEIAGAIRIVASTSPSWNDLALIGAQVSVRLAALGIDPPLSDHLEPVRLSARQREIAWLVARGCTNGEIATIVGCTSHGVKKQLSRVLVLLDLTNRAELAAIAARWSETTEEPHPAEPQCRIFRATPVTVDPGSPSGSS